MELKWIVLMLSVWIVVALLVGGVEGVLIGGDYDPNSGEPQATSTLNDLLTGDFFARTSALGNMVTFRFPAIFYGSWAILRWIFFLPFVIAFGIMMSAYILSHIPVIGRGS